MSTYSVQAASDDDVRAVRRVLDEAIPAALPAWLESRRWFSDKGRPIAGVEIGGSHLGRAGGDLLALTVVRVAFADGGRADYFVPLALTDGAEDTDIVLQNEITLVDATAVKAFAPWLLDLMAASAASDDGRWVFGSHPDATKMLEAAREQPAALLRGEQSNTSLRYGDAVILKLVRRLQPAPNPEEEVLRGLSQSGFRGVPAFVGSGSWFDGGGTEYPIMLAQAVVPNIGDGWNWTLRRLQGLATASENGASDAFSPERLLGRRTAEMHLALSRISGPDFVPELPDRAGIEADKRHSRDAATQAIELLRERARMLSETVRADLPRIIGGLREATRRSEGFAAEAGVPRIRVHGDFHLGQTLRTPDADWAIIDFEGEPARPVSVRRQKSSALKDVAGMLRSFAYARGAVERSLVHPHDLAPRQRLNEWEHGAREAFLRGYRETIETAPTPLVPQEDTAFQHALAAWEIDKALYEIAYEARNRPDWLEIPLLTLVPEHDSGPA